MQASGKSWFTHKIWLALPIILLLLLARCSGENNDETEASSQQNQATIQSSGEPQASVALESSSNKRFTSSQIKAAMREHIANAQHSATPVFSK